jgi:hypothetical protein
MNSEMNHLAHWYFLSQQGGNSRFADVDGVAANDLAIARVNPNVDFELEAGIRAGVHKFRGPGWNRIDREGPIAASGPEKIRFSRRSDPVSSMRPMVCLEQGLLCHRGSSWNFSESNQACLELFSPSLCRPCPGTPPERGAGQCDAAVFPGPWSAAGNA